ncbi:MAG: PEPxxWA-CTERM sorting domain-containing protein [Sandaracinobacteroides sp.]
MENAKQLPTLAVVALLLGAAGAADAAVVGGTVTGGTTPGGFFVIAPPAQVGSDNQQSDNVFAWDEQQNVLLGSALVIDLGGTSIAAGTWISSHGIVFDSIAQQTFTGSITFDSAILGIVLRTDNLPGSDFLGTGGTIYNTVTGRGSEPLAHDTTSFAGNVLSFNWRSGTPGDNIRVLTAGTPAVPGVSVVPEPATWAMMILGFGLVGFAARRSGAAARTVA